MRIVHPLSVVFTAIGQSLLKVLILSAFSAVFTCANTHAAIVSKSEPKQVMPSSDTIRVIFNGENLSRDPVGNAQSFVAQVEVDLNDAGDYYKCMGVAIDIDMVLTAGHCVRGSDKNIQVKFVSNLDPLNFETIQVKAYRMHPRTNAGLSGNMYLEFSEDVSEQYHDIAVLYLKSPSIYADPIKVVPREFAAEKLEQPVLYVFGRGRDGLYRDKDNIEFAGLNNVVPMRSGPNYYRATLDILRESAPQLVCIGDSGAPVTVSAKDEYTPGRNIHYLVGIFVLQVAPVPPKDMKKALKVWKKTENIPVCGKTLGYVNVQENVRWIEDAMNELDPSRYRQLLVFGREVSDHTYGDESNAYSDLQDDKNASNITIAYNDSAVMATLNDTYNRFHNYELTGETAVSKNVGSMAECEIIGEMGPYVAYTYDAWNRICHLKREVGQKVLNARTRSGVRADLAQPEQSSIAIGFEFFDNKAFPNSGYSSLPTVNRNECAAKCGSENTCIGFNFSKKKHICDLFDEVEVHSERSFFVSGAKVQLVN